MTAFQKKRTRNQKKRCLFLEQNEREVGLVKCDGSTFNDLFRSLVVMIGI